MGNQLVVTLILATILFSRFAGATVIHPEDQLVRRIAFGSCMKESRPKPVLREVVKTNPDLMLFIGDNIYGDSENLGVLAAKYARLGADPDFQELKRRIPIQATWDDHDFGVNDGGASYPLKAETKKLMLNFFEEPTDSERRVRAGVYTSSISGPPGKQVQMILLDTRWFRSPLKVEHRIFRKDIYIPDDNPASTFLGTDQWAWLERQLKIPAEVRFIVSSIQVISRDRVGHEKWQNFPHERTRLIDLLKKTSGKKLILSGDIHRAELSCLPESEGGLCDFTSSGITQTEGPNKLIVRSYPNRYRVHTFWDANNFGSIEIDWSQALPGIRLQLITDKGQSVFGYSL